MEGNGSTTKSSRRTKVYGLIVICLLLSIGVVFIARASFRESAVKPQLTKPAVAHAADVKITPEKLKQAADKQVELLLARLQKSPNDSFLLAEIAKIYYQTRQFAMAAKYYEDSVRVKPTTAVFVKLGGAHHFAGDEDKAVAAWNDALRLDPNNPDALFNIGFVKWHAQGDQKAAIAAWQRLLKANPNHPKRAQVEELLSQVKRDAETPAAGNQ